MNKRKLGRKLSRGRGARGALMRSLVRSLVLHGKIETTKTKAKFFVPYFEKILNKAKTDNVAVRREILAKLGNDKDTLKKIFEMGPKKVRVLAKGSRKGDNAIVVKVELI